MTLKLKNCKRQRKVWCLIDCDFITKEAAQDMSKLWFVLIYTGKQSKMLKQMSTGIKLEDRLVFVPLFVDENMNINYEIPWRNTVNKKSQNVSFVDSFMKTVRVGYVDIIQYFLFSVGGGFNL